MASHVHDTSKWTIQYTADSQRPLTSEIAKALREASVNVGEPSKISGPATLGVAEIMITIVVVAAAKAVVVAGLHAVQKILEQQIDAGSDQRAQIIIQKPDGERKHFPVSLRSFSKDALNEFITTITAVVNKL